MEIGTTPSRAGAVAFLTFWWGMLVGVFAFVEYWLYLIEPKLTLMIPFSLMFIGSLVIPCVWTQYYQPKWKQDIGSTFMAIWIMGVISGLVTLFIKFQQARQALGIIILFFGTVAILGTLFEWSNKVLKGKKKNGEIRD